MILSPVNFYNIFNITGFIFGNNSIIFKIPTSDNMKFK